MKLIYPTFFLLTFLPLSSYIYANEELTCKEVQFKSSDNTWVGHYYLKNVMETGSELLLEKNGKFKWYLTIGGLEQYAEGTWWKNENCIGLKAAPEYIQYLMVFPARLDTLNKELSITWINGQKNGVYSQ